MRKSLLLVLAVLPLVAQAQVYRWVDDKGKVHYGDRPLGTENSRVRGLVDPTAAAETLPKPGMKADEVRAAYGEPERIRKVSTKNGETEIWSYAKGKRVKRDFVVKVEGGEVTEVATDTASATARPVGASNAQNAARAVADADYQHQQQAMAQREAEQKEQRCTSLRESYQRIENQERRGGSAAMMDSLREQKRQYSAKLSAQGC